jgi:hypothetical protein
MKLTRKFCVDSHVTVPGFGPEFDIGKEVLMVLYIGDLVP